MKSQSGSDKSKAGKSQQPMKISQSPKSGSSSQGMKSPARSNGRSNSQRLQPSQSQNHKIQRPVVPRRKMNSDAELIKDLNRLVRIHSKDFPYVYRAMKSTDLDAVNNLQKLNGDCFSMKDLCADVGYGVKCYGAIAYPKGRPDITAAYLIYTDVPPERVKVAEGGHSTHIVHIDFSCADKRFRSQSLGILMRFIPIIHAIRSDAQYVTSYPMKGRASGPILEKKFGFTVHDDFTVMIDNISRAFLSMQGRKESIFVKEFIAETNAALSKTHDVKQRIEKYDDAVRSANEPPPQPIKLRNARIKYMLCDALRDAFSDNMGDNVFSMSNSLRGHNNDAMFAWSHLMNHFHLKDSGTLDDYCRQIRSVNLDTKSDYEAFFGSATIIMSSLSERARMAQKRSRKRSRHHDRFDQVPISQSQRKRSRF